MRKSAFRSTITVAAMLGLFLTSNAFAQTSGPVGDASTPLTKQQLKAKRKADRAAARAKNKAELKTLEKNGYDPNQNAARYPENLQNAEKKAGSN